MKAALNSHLYPAYAFISEDELPGTRTLVIGMQGCALGCDDGNCCCPRRPSGGCGIPCHLLSKYVRNIMSSTFPDLHAGRAVIRGCDPLCCGMLQLLELAADLRYYGCTDMTIETYGSSTLRELESVEFRRLIDIVRTWRVFVQAYPAILAEYTVAGTPDAGLTAHMRIGNTLAQLSAARRKATDGSLCVEVVTPVSRRIASDAALDAIRSAFISANALEDSWYLVQDDAGTVPAEEIRRLAAAAGARVRLHDTAENQQQGGNND